MSCLTDIHRIHTVESVCVTANIPKCPLAVCGLKKTDCKSMSQWNSRNIKPFMCELVFPSPGRHPHPPPLPPLCTPSAVTCASACLCCGESWWPRFSRSLLPTPVQAVCTPLPAPNPHCARTSVLWPTSPWQQLHNAQTMQQRLEKRRKV